MPGESPDPALMRRDIQTMLTFIQGARIVSMAREVEISRFQGWLADRFVVGLFVSALVLSALLVWDAAGWWGGSHAALLAGLVILVVCSRNGAIVSIGRRMRDENLGVGSTADSIYTLAAMGSGKNGFRLALASSHVFGLVMYALLASGLPAILGLNGGIVPSFASVEINRLRDRADVAARQAGDLRDALARQCSRRQPIAAADAGGASSVGEDAIGSEPTAEATPPAEGVTPTAGDGDAVVDANLSTPAAPSPTPSPSSTAPPPTACADLQDEVAKQQKFAEASRLDWVAAREGQLKSSPAGDGWLEALRIALGLASIPDLFKMLIWAFVAGFFEQLVPDMLDRINARTRESAQREAAAR